MGFFGKDNLDSMDDLLLAQIKDLYDAELRILDALPELIGKANSANLKAAFNNHHKETYTHVKRLEEIFENLGEPITRETCKATKGLLVEVEETIAREGNAEVLDAALIAAAQRVEHYEISAYGSAKAFADKCGQSRIAELLEATLQEEHAADRKLTMIAAQSINDMAASASAHM